MHAPSLLGVILAAGASSRMGHPKGLLSLPDGRSLLQAHLDGLATACDRVLVVTGAHTPNIQATLSPGTWNLHNPHWQTTGAVDSLALALTESGARCAIVTPVDVPPVRSTDLAALVAAPAPAILSWNDQPGHPVFLDDAICRRVASGPVKGGLRTLLGQATRVQASTPDVLLNLNSPEDWKAWVSGVART